MQNFRSLGHLHGLEEAPVVHQPSPGHPGEIFFGLGRALYGPLQFPESFTKIGPAIYPGYLQDFLENEWAGAKTSPGTNLLKNCPRLSALAQAW